ncbi:MAG: hypothetical protein U5O39_14520 [Gammaproteobacteria bacterium]|nr:hypothetical protein [Gammaproteobacteria bacterium]
MRSLAKIEEFLNTRLPGTLLAATILAITAPAAADHHKSKQPSPTSAQQGAGPEAGDGSPRMGQGGAMQKLMQKRQEIQQLNQQLVKIQKETIEENPNIDQKRKDFIAMVDTKMKDAGHEPEAARANIEKLRDKLRNGELSQQESQSAKQKLQQQMSSFQKARRSAMQDKEVKAERESLNKELMMAMQEQDPETQELITELRQTQREYQKIMQTALQQQQSSSGQAPGRSP